jgi:hypothetical protein
MAIKALLSPLDNQHNLPTPWQVRKDRRAAEQRQQPTAHHFQAVSGSGTSSVGRRGGSPALAVAPQSTFNLSSHPPIFHPFPSVNSHIGQEQEDIPSQSSTATRPGLSWGSSASPVVPLPSSALSSSLPPSQPIPAIHIHHGQGQAGPPVKPTKTQSRNQKRRRAARKHIET